VKPKSLSASALNVADACMARYYAEQIKRAPNLENPAATLGTACHLALELYVQDCYINKTREPGWPLLLTFWKMAYMQTFGVVETTGELYDDGFKMLKGWFNRTDIDEVEVISCEQKDNFKVKTSIGEIPFNYIWDRQDLLEPDVYRVVDYKTSRAAVSPEDLHKKIQARAYGVACQIAYPNAKKIWVEFDMLRHDRVATVFSREENIAAWKFIRKSAEKIIAADESDIQETLNEECGFCIRKARCKTLHKNIDEGGIFSLAGDAAIDMRAELDHKIKALGRLKDDLDKILMTELTDSDLEYIESQANRLSLTASKTRRIDPEFVIKVVGEEIFGEYGGAFMNISAFDNLLSDDRLTQQQKKQLKGLVSTKLGQPRIKVTPLGRID
jgi:RecB family exonuclease